MLKLVSDYGRWATKGNSMIFGNVVWLMDGDIERNVYHLIDENGNDLKVNVRDFLVDD